MGLGQFPAQGRVTDHQEAVYEVGGGYTPLAAAMEEAYFEEIGVYIKKS